MKKRIFSGIQPSGVLHIGNYLGAIKNWVELQKEYESIFCIVDLHALTVPQDPKQLKKNTLEAASTYLAAGINPQKSMIFVQSHVPEHAELTWLLNTIAKIPELERMTQFKEKSKEHHNAINMGLFDYPVLMAADILLYHTSAVPVGDDQRQHVELARTLAQRFNNLYEETFTIPEALIKKEGARVMGLDDPFKKMSKSAANENNYIALSDSPDVIERKIKRAVTDSEKEIQYTIERPGLANLMTIYHCCSGMSFEKIEKKYRGKGYAQFKKDLAEVIIKELKPFQEKKQELAQDPDYLNEILMEGAEKAQVIAHKTLEDVKKKMGLI